MPVPQLLHPASHKFLHIRILPERSIILLLCEGSSSIQEIRGQGPDYSRNEWTPDSLQCSPGLQNRILINEEDAQHAQTIEPCPGHRPVDDRVDIRAR